MTVLVSTHYMDEAERCHEIAYIAYGELLAQGTIPEVIAQSHLRTYTVSGPDLQSLPRSCSGMPGIDMVAPFGTSLHVAGRDADALDAAVASFRDHPELHWSAVAAVAGGRVHRPDGPVAGQLPMIDLPAALAALAGPVAHGRHVHQGVRAAAPRPPDLRHHDLHPASCSCCCSASPSTPRRATCPPPCWCTRRATSTRSILAALRNTSYFARHARRRTRKPRWTTGCARATCCSASRSRPASSAACGAATGRPCWWPPTPAIRSPPAPRSARSKASCRTALARDRGLPETIQSVPAFEIRQHRRYNPAAVTSLNIVPGLLGTILTMTMLIFTALSVTREIERGTMESLLAMPIQPLEIMLGKIAPYIVIGFLQAALILLFGVAPVRGADRRAASGCWRRSARCSSPPTCRSATPSRPSPRTSCRRSRCPSCSSCPTSCCRASCSRSPACRAGRRWSARCLPLTHYIRIVRGIMLKGADLYDLQIEALALAGPHAARHDAGRAPLPPHAGLRGASALPWFDKLTTRVPGC